MRLPHPPSARTTTPAVLRNSIKRRGLAPLFLHNLYQIAAFATNSFVKDFLKHPLPTYYRVARPARRGCPRGRGRSRAGTCPCTAPPRARVRRRLELRLPNAAVAVRGPQQADVTSDSIERDDAVHPFSLDCRLALQLQTK